MIWNLLIKRWGASNTIPLCSYTIITYSISSPVYVSEGRVSRPRPLQRSLQHNFLMPSQSKRSGSRWNLTRLEFVLVVLPPSTHPSYATQRSYNATTLHSNTILEYMRNGTVINGSPATPLTRMYQQRRGVSCNIMIIIILIIMIIIIIKNNDNNNKNNDNNNKI